jgi:signal transduction histidine kinase/CheY-like chemotaxis protein
MFGIFLFCCGTTHVIEAWTLWRPVYRLEGVVKTLTAVASLSTALILWPLIPKALALPSAATLRRTNDELAREILERRHTEESLRRHREHLEVLIEERTAALKRINQQLSDENHERRQAQRALALAKEAAEQASRAKTQFLANMSHELRTPLNAIIGFSEVLEDRTFGPLNDRQNRYVSNILTSGRDLLQLINDVLDLSKVEAGRMELDPTPFNVRDALQDIQKVVKALAAKKHIELSIDANGEDPPVAADQPKFKQIMYNLLSNAIKFTPDRGRVTVRAEIVDSNRDGDRAAGVPLPAYRVAVADTGIGIAPGDHDRVFHEFEQLDSSFQRMHEGSGLGLALTRKLVELHGGRIWVESEGSGKGSTFAFLLPLSPPARPPEETTNEAGLPTAADAPTPQVRPVVLVVEDDEHARELLTHYLCSAGYSVAHARDGEEAVRVARELTPAVITLDVLLPKRDGWEVLRALKTYPETRQTPVIIVSITKDARLGFSLGAMDWLVKPVNKERLVESVRRVASGVGKRSMTVLVVDDEPETIEILSHILRSEGHRVLSTLDGARGVEMALHHLPDAIVLDLNMPGISGFDVVQQLREHPQAKRIPVLVFTAMDLTAEERLRLSSEIQAIVPKSAREELIQVLSNLRSRKVRV